MGKDYDFSKIGKRMPYKVPEGFFKEMEERIWEETGHAPAVPAPNRRAILPAALKWAMATAAIAALIFLANLHPSKDNAGSLTRIEEAYERLSMEDQAHMLEIYQEDLFINH